MAAFNSLGHVALKVRDLEASVGFYEKLGFPEFLRLLEDDGSPWIVYMRFDDNLYLELFPGGDGPADTRAPGSTICHSLSTTSRRPSGTLPGSA